MTTSTWTFTGYLDIKTLKGIERADRLVKEAAKEMVGKNEEFYEGVAEKKK